MDLFLEISAVLFSVIYVLLAARKSIYCWFFGIFGSALSIALFFKVGLVAESILFIFYVIMGIYGWVQWNKESGRNGNMPVESKPLLWHILVVVIGYLLTGALSYILQEFTEAKMPLLDSFTTVFSLIATWMVTRRLIENWIYWICIDALTIYLYASRDLYIYATLSFVYTIIAVYGFLEWKKSLRTIST